MEKRKYRNKIEILAIAIILIIAVLLVSFFSSHQFNSNEIRIKNFFAEKENTFEVVHIGASEMYASFSPEYIWKNYGVATYNIATDGAPMGVAKTQIKTAIKEHNPKLIVISLNGAQYDDMRAEHEGYMRMWIDNIPEGELRQEAIDELVRKDKNSYKFKFLKYHSNVARFWECFQLSGREIKANTTKRLLTISGMQGKASTDDKRQLPNPVDMKAYDDKMALGEKTEKQLDSLLAYLKENNIENVVFVNMPRFYDWNNKKMLKTKSLINTAAEKCENAGYKVYDFDQHVDEIGLDPRKDYYNSGHLNIFGQQKMSKYFYENIAKDYSFDKAYDEETKKRWDENYDIYTKVYAWVEDMIASNNKYRIKYDYKVIEYISNGTIKDHEKYLIEKAKLRLKHKKAKGKLVEGIDGEEGLDEDMRGKP